MIEENTQVFACLGDTKFPVTLLQAADAYIRSGITITPCDYRSKIPLVGTRPTPASWALCRGSVHVHEVSSEEVPVYFFGNGYNIAIRSGKSSNGLIDVDLDRPEAIAVAQYILPPTRKSGREGKELGHFWYLIEGQIPNSRWFRLPKKMGKRMVVELRSTGTQTLAPPSIYPEGERCVWGGDKIFRISGDKLVEYVDDVAAAALLRLHCPDDVGARRKFVMSAAGYLSSRLAPQRVKRIITALVRTLEDQEWLGTPFLAKDLEGVVDKIVTGKRVKGVGAFQRVAPEVAVLLLRWFQWEGQPTKVLPRRLLQGKRNSPVNKPPLQPPLHKNVLSSLEFSLESLLLSRENSRASEAGHPQPTARHTSLFGPLSPGPPSR